MSLSQSTMALDLSPRSAREARRWAADVCRELGRPELVQSAELAVSELVTNALLHASPPIRVSLHGTADHPRFEVSDGSPVAPVPHPRNRPAGSLSNDDDHLSTIGRGLDLVAMSSSAWGAYVHDHGKTVWFEPTDDLNENPRFFSELHEIDDDTTPNTRPTDTVTVHLLDFPVQRYADWLGHFRDLQRELRLLALAHESTYPLARELSGFLSDFVADLREAGGLRDPSLLALPDGSLTVRVSRKLEDTLEQMARVLELADVFCRKERMLTPPTSPENLAFQRWLFEQTIGQLRGAAPVAWSAPVPAPSD